MRILLVDDDKDLCFLTKTVLVQNGYQVDTFGRVEEGLRHARERPPQLILLDVMLPGMTGPEAVETLQTDSTLKNIPVIFLTALISGQEKGVVEEGLNIRGVHYPTLGKPYGMEELLGAVHKYTRRVQPD